MCSPVVLGLGVRPEDDTRPVEADDVRLGHNMTDDISNYLHALGCGQIRDLDEEGGGYTYRLAFE